MAVACCLLPALLLNVHSGGGGGADALATVDTSDATGQSFGHDWEPSSAAELRAVLRCKYAQSLLWAASTVPFPK